MEMRYCKDHVPTNVAVVIIHQNVVEAFLSEGCSVCGLKTKELFTTEGVPEVLK